MAVGNLFYGSDGWAAMSDQGFQAYKGDSSELIMEDRPERRLRRFHRPAHAEFSGVCEVAAGAQSLHDPIANAVPSTRSLPYGEYQLPRGPRAEGRTGSDAQVHRRRRGDENGHAPGLSEGLRGLGYERRVTAAHQR